MFRKTITNGHEDHQIKVGRIGQILDLLVQKYVKILTNKKLNTMSKLTNKIKNLFRKERPEDQAMPSESEPIQMQQQMYREAFFDESNVGATPPPNVPEQQQYSYSSDEIKTLKEMLLNHVEQLNFEAVPEYNNGIQAFKIASPAEFSKPLIELGKGLEEKVVEVVEISESGSVNNLKVVNKSNKFLLIYEGSLLEGEKQNRVVNTTLLLEPESETVIPVSCVEQGRWERKTQGFSKPDYDGNSAMRRSLKKQIMMQKQGYSASQREIWDEVAKFATKEKMSNKTSDYSDYYQNSKKENFVFKKGLNFKTKGVFVRAYNEDYLDYVNDQAAFSEVLERVSKGYEVDQKEKSAEPITEPKVYFKDILNETHQDLLVQDSVGLGKDIRFEMAHHYVSVLQVEDEVLALSFCKKEG